MHQRPVQEMVEFTVIYNKQKYELKFALDETVDTLKTHIEKLTGNNCHTCKILLASNNINNNNIINNNNSKYISDYIPCVL